MPSPKHLTRTDTPCSTSASNSTHSPCAATAATLPPCGVSVHLRQHQLRLVQRLLDTSSTLPHRQLFVAPTGSGKTIAGIVAGVCLLERGVVDGVHVVVPKSVVKQFETEIERLVPLHLTAAFRVHTHATYFSAPSGRGRRPVCSPANKLLIVDEAHALSTEISGGATKESARTSSASSHARRAGGSPSSARTRRRVRAGGTASASASATAKTTVAHGGEPSASATTPSVYKGSRAYHAIRAAHQAKGVLLMTATPLTNSPTDLMNLLCMVCGYTLPVFTKHPHVAPVHKLLQKAQKQFLLSGNRPALKQALQSPEVYMFVKWMGSKIMFAARSTEGLPSVEDKTVRLPMTPEYLKLYNAVECNQLTEFQKQLQKRQAAQTSKHARTCTRTCARSRTRAPPAAATSKSTTATRTDQPCDTQNPCLVSPLRCVFQPDAVDAFYMKLRQAVNGVTNTVVSAKVEYAAKVAREGHRRERRVVVYSNFLDGGLSLVAHQLTSGNEPVPFVHIWGKCTQSQRQSAVTALNSGSVHVLLLSRAGCEGLDLKGVRDVVLLEPHFHNERLQQVIGRAIRFRSHDALPAAERNVTIHRLLLQKPADNHATWAEAERHNEAQIRQLLDTYRIRAYQRTVELAMNVPNKLLFDNIRQVVWQEMLSKARTGAAARTNRASSTTSKDPFDKVHVDTQSIDPTDFTVYVRFTDGADTDMDTDMDEWGNDSLGMYDMFSGGFGESATERVGHDTGTDTGAPVTYHDTYRLRNVPRDLSVDDVVQQLAERKELLNSQFLQLFKRHSA